MDTLSRYKILAVTPDGNFELTIRVEANGMIEADVVQVEQDIALPPVVSAVFDERQEDPLERLHRTWAYQDKVAAERMKAVFGPA